MKQLICILGACLFSLVDLGLLFKILSRPPVQNTTLPRCKPDASFGNGIYAHPHHPHRHLHRRQKTKTTIV